MPAAVGGWWDDAARGTVEWGGGRLAAPALRLRRYCQAETTRFLERWLAAAPGWNGSHVARPAPAPYLCPESCHAPWLCWRGAAWHHCELGLACKVFF